MSLNHPVDTSTNVRRTRASRWTRLALFVAAFLLLCLLVVPLLPVVVPCGLRVGGWIAVAEVYNAPYPYPRGPWFSFYQRPLQGEPLPGAAAGAPLPWSEGRECQFHLWRWTYRLMLARQR